MPDDVALSMEGGWKRYGASLGRELLRRWWPRRRTPPAGREGPWALSDVTFSVRRGEVLGVIGTNGAGKSTLLKVLAGVSPLTRGSFRVYGRLFSMIELNAGIHNELTGRQNVYLLGAFMGFSRGQMRRRMPEIEEFCELGEFFDRPVRTYSTGMLARLGFAVAVNVDADVLLVDEVLAVGDLPFQRKCFAKMDSLYRSGKSLVFVSHALRMVERLCSQTLYLSRGRVAGIGPTADIITQYQIDTSAELLQRKTAGKTASPAADGPEAELPVRVLAVDLLDVSGAATTAFRTGEPMTIRVRYESDLDAAFPSVGMGISQETVLITGFSNELLGRRMPLARGRGAFCCRIPRLMLLGGVYSLTLKIRGEDGATLGGLGGGVYFSVHTPPEIRRSHEYGYVTTDVQWLDESSAAAA